MKTIKKKPIESSLAEPTSPPSGQNREDARKPRVKCGRLRELKVLLESKGLLLPELSLSDLKNLFKDSESFIAIFGEDNRKELYELSSSKIINAKKAAAIIHKSLLKDNGTSYTIIPSGKMIYSRRGRKLCSWESFYGQPEAAYCTSCALHERIAIMPKHSNRHFYPEQMRLVYGFWNDAVSDPLQIPKENVIEITKVINDPSEDLSFLILNDPVSKDRLVSKYAEPKQGQQIYVSGYPGTSRDFNRIPLKVADNAKVRKVYSTKFESDLDVFRGNSGSPVFNNDNFIGMFISVPSDHFTPFSNNCDLSCYCDEKDFCDHAVCISSDYIM